jgi:hypothetical protein
MAAEALFSKAIAEVQVVYRISPSSPVQSDSAREGSSHVLVPSKSDASMVMAQSARQALRVQGGGTESQLTREETIKVRVKIKVIVRKEIVMSIII